MLIGDFIEFGLNVGDFEVNIDEFEEKSELDFDWADIFASGRIVSRGGKL